MHTSYLVDLLSILSMHTIRTIRMHTLLILASSSSSKYTYIPWRSQPFGDIFRVFIRFTINVY